MLKDIDAAVIIAVKDISRARDFYQNTLGLEPAGGDDHHHLRTRGPHRGGRGEGEGDAGPQAEPGRQGEPPAAGVGH